MLRVSTFWPTQAECKTQHCSEVTIDNARRGVAGFEIGLPSHKSGVSNMKNWLSIMLGWVLLSAGLAYGSGSTFVEVSVTPSQVNFGSQDVGTQSDRKTVTLSVIPGVGALIPNVVISDIASSSPEFQIMDNNCVTIGGEGDASCTFDAAFLPSNLGEFVADLLVDCRLEFSTQPGGLTAVIVCPDEPEAQTQTVAEFFRGLGVAASAAPVPTLGQWGITLLALALLGFGVMRLRRS
jgi:hypothetical protein